jgi:hypothetical protein
MKKLAIGATAVIAALGITTSALGAGETYSNAGSSISPAKSGTAKAPKPAFGKTLFNITNPAGQRPDVIETYKIGLGEGLVENTGLFKSCLKAQIEDPNKGPKTCPAESNLGGGVAYNLAGAASDPNAKIECDLKLTLFAGGKGKVNLVVESNPPALPCPLTVNPTVVPATFKKVGGILTLTLTVPNALLHPIPGFNNALYKTVVNKFGKTKRAKIGKVTRTVGIIETVSCPKSHKRTLKTTFVTEAGLSTTSKTTSKCS